MFRIIQIQMNVAFVRNNNIFNKNIDRYIKMVQCTYGYYFTNLLQFCSFIQINFVVNFGGAIFIVTILDTFSIVLAK